MKFKKNCWFALLALPPFLIIGGLHIGNLINDTFPSVNINPFSIGNIEWFLFFGSYLGGVCTLIAVYFTMKQNQRVTTYQQEMQIYANEATVISNTLSSFNLWFVDKVFTEISNIKISNKVFDEIQVVSLIKSIIEEREKITQHQIKLALETSIYQDNCGRCKNKYKCEKGKVIIAFSRDYTDTFNKQYKSLSDLKEYVDIKTNNLKNSKIIGIANNIMNNASQFTSQEVQEAEDVNIQATMQMREDKVLFEEIKKHVFELESMQENQMKNLVSLSKKYIAVCRNLAYSQMNCKTTWSFEEETEV